MKLFELPHFAKRAPPKIAVPRVSEIGVGDGLEAARPVEARGQLMAQALVLNEAVLARRMDGLFVEALRVQFPPFQTRELCANQCRPVCERCRTVVCPDRYLLEMRSQRFQMLGPFFGRGHIATHRSCKRRVEMVLSNLELRWRRPKHRFSFRCSRNRRRVAAA